MWKVLLAPWSTVRDRAAAIRYEVFVEEQKVPVEEELDEMDALSLHALALDAQGEAVATGRLLPNGHIGRMAVKRSVRGQSAGASVLEALVGVARERGFTEVVLGAQLHARGFYAKQGFVEYGEVFMDANIEHIMMKKSLGG